MIFMFKLSLFFHEECTLLSVSCVLHQHVLSRHRLAICRL